MSPITAVSQVFDAIQKAKTGASAFCSNFFPVEGKLQAWIDHGELLGELREGVVFFLRRDRDFWHLYFCAVNLPTLQRELRTPSGLSRERVTVDLVGREGSLNDLLNAAESAGFRRYSRLLRLARSNQSAQAQSPTGDVLVDWADGADAPQILDLLEKAFDPYADQLPVPYEIEAAIEAKQILAIKCDGVVAAFLHFETQGFTSTVRYWVVAEQFRSKGFGAALIRHYFASHPTIRRFILWVAADNENAVQKYRHYGYAPDGLIDHVLVNKMVP
jgi:ribosomal protein S18 acetylase RimI-like enzyme